MIEIISYISVLTSGADDSQIVHEYSMKQYERAERDCEDERRL